LPCSEGAGQRGARKLCWLEVLFEFGAPGRIRTCPRLRRPILFAAPTCRNTPWPHSLGGVWGEERVWVILSMRTERAVSQEGQVAAFARVSGLRKDTITASEAV